MAGGRLAHHRQPRSSTPQPAFRSLLIAAITAALNLLSAATSFGVLTAFFQWAGAPGPSASARPAPVEGYLPGLALAILFGLATDYRYSWSAGWPGNGP